jgi:MFS family permease
MKNDPTQRGYASHAPAVLQKTDHQSLWGLLKGFKHVFAYRNTWLIFCAQGGFVGTMIAFTGLWGPPFLKVRYGLPSTTAAAVCSVMTICWAVASPIVGHWSNKIGRQKPIYLTGAIFATLGLTVMFYLPGLPLWLFVVIAGLTSFACGAVILGFAFAKESVPVQFLGDSCHQRGNMIGPPAAAGDRDARRWSADGERLRVYQLATIRPASP